MAYNYNFGRSGNSPQRNAPIVLNLIIINALVYAAQVMIPNFNVTEWGALHYYQSPLFKPFQFVTSMFMHDPTGINHLLFNMFALWVFGSTLEKYLGSKKFLIFYLICGIGANIVIELTIPFSAGLYANSAEGLSTATQLGYSKAQIVQGYMQEYSSIGASGAIMGVMAAFAYLFPNTALYIMFIPIPVKAKFVIPVLVLIDLFGGLNPSGDNIGHFAHLGGALIGFIIVLIWNKTNRKTFY